MGVAVGGSGVEVGDGSGVAVGAAGITPQPASNVTSTIDQNKRENPGFNIHPPQVKTKFME
jgi:hypothetical protein